MLAQFTEFAEADVRTHEEYRLAFLSCQDDLVRCTDAVNIGRTEADDEITGVDHAQVNVKCGPETVCDLRPLSRALFTSLVGPDAPNIRRAFSLFAVLF